MTSGQEISQGYNYFGSFAAVLCYGRVDKIYKIFNGDTVIWAGTIDRFSADVNGLTILNTSIGTVRFYWGSDIQNTDDILAGLLIDLGAGPVTVPIGAFRGVCYYICQDVAFGSQVTPPILTFWLQRNTYNLTIAGDPQTFGHQIDNDANLPEAIYDLLTNAFYGCGISTGDMDGQSFIDAANVVRLELIGASPMIDNTESARELIGKMLSYIDGFLYLKNGKLAIGLTRAKSTVGLPILDESALVEEPHPTPSQFDETWNLTLITFTDRENKWETTTEQYDEKAHAAIVGQRVTKVLNFPWLTIRRTAKVVAKHFGLKGALPTIFCDLKLKPSFDFLHVGDTCYLTYAKLGIVNQLVRVMRLKRGKPSSPDVEATVGLEQVRDIANDYTPPTDTFSVPGTVDAGGSNAFVLASTTPRLAWLPDDLKAGEADGFLVAMNRPSSLTTGASIYWTWNPGVYTYRLIAGTNSFPAKGTMIDWRRIRSTNWLLRVQMDTGDDMARIQNLVSRSITLYAVAGKRLYKTVGTPKNEHRATSLWLSNVAGGLFNVVSANTVEIEMSGAAFGTDDLALEGLATDGVYPTIHIYFGLVEDFAIVPTSAINFERNAGNSISDTALIRYIKTPVKNALAAQDVATVTATTFDRDDTTMSPDGTLSRDWGALAESGYQYFDEQSGLQAQSKTAPGYALLATLDADFGKLAQGLASAGEILYVADADAVLGKVAGAGQGYYNV